MTKTISFFMKNRRLAIELFESGGIYHMGIFFNFRGILFGFKVAKLYIYIWSHQLKG